VILLSHPADYTRACTTEFMTCGKLCPQFQALDCELIGLSINSNYRQIAWLRTLAKTSGWRDMQGVRGDLHRDRRPDGFLGLKRLAGKQPNASPLAVLGQWRQSAWGAGTRTGRRAADVPTLGQECDLYSDKVLDHFHHPRNVGHLEDAEGMAQVGDPDCGDYLLLFLRIREGQITAARFLCRGCPAAIACASVTTELAIGRRVDDAWEITDETIVEALDGLPEGKLHCSNLGAAALQVALLDYYMRRDCAEAPVEATDGGPVTGDEADGG